MPTNRIFAFRFLWPPWVDLLCLRGGRIPARRPTGGARRPPARVSVSISPPLTTLPRTSLFSSPALPRLEPDSRKPLPADATRRRPPTPVTPAEVNPAPCDARPRAVPPAERPALRGKKRISHCPVRLAPAAHLRRHHRMANAPRASPRRR